MIPYVFVLQCVLAIGVGYSSASAQDANLLAGAKREGRVVWYSVAGESQQQAGAQRCSAESISSIYLLEYSLR